MLSSLRDSACINYTPHTPKKVTKKKKKKKTRQQNHNPWKPTKTIVKYCTRSGQVRVFNMHIQSKLL